MRLFIGAQVFSPTSSAVIVAPTAEALFGLWCATAPQLGAPGTGHRFASFAAVEAACAHGGAAMGAAIEVRLPGERARVATTVGRVLLAEALPVQVGFESVNRSINAAAAARIIEAAHTVAGHDGAAAVARELWSFGVRAATESGLSLSRGDLRSPAAMPAILAEARAARAWAEEQWDDGQLTEGERYNCLIRAWIAAEARARDALTSELASRPPLGVLCASGALEGLEAAGRCVGMIGVTRNPGGDLAELPVIHGFAEGLSAHESFRVAIESRANAVGTLAREAESRVLGEQLTSALGSVRITLLDCGARDGVTVGCLLDSHRVVVELGTRVLGRALVDEVRSADGRTILAGAGSIVDEASAARIDRARVLTARIRSPLTCAAATGICARCYGWDAQTRRPIRHRAPVGLAAARAITSLAPHLVSRMIYLGGDGHERDRDADTTTAAGVIQYDGVDVARPREGADRVMMGSRGRVTLLDDHGEAIESFLILHGDRPRVDDGERVSERRLVVERCGHEGKPIFAAVPVGAEAVVSFIEGEIEPNETIWFPGGVHGRRVLAASGTTMRLDLNGVGGPLDVVQLELPGHAIVLVAAGARVRRGHLLAVIPYPVVARGTVWTRDYCGGLPRLLEVARAREPKRADTFRESPRELLKTFGVDWMANGLVGELCDLFGYAKQPIAAVHLELLVHEMLRDSSLRGIEDLARAARRLPDP